MSGTQHVPNVIDLVDVTLDHPRGGAPLMAGANLGVAAGEVVLIAAAGVGTSRLVAAALGEAPLGGGRIDVLGRDVAKLRRASLRLIRRRIGIVPHDLCLLDDRSAQLNVVLPLEIDGVPRCVSVVRANQVLAQLGLEDEASLPVDCLSDAERQRVAIARALVREPELVLADQPTSFQDPAGAEIVCTALAIAAARGAACIVLGHDPKLRELAERHHWRQLALVDGRLQPLVEVAEVGEIEPMQEPGIETGEVSMPNVVPFPLAAGAAGG
jgi:ABC-type ATPase involved in cell division